MWGRVERQGELPPYQVTMAVIHGEKCRRDGGSLVCGREVGSDAGRGDPTLVMAAMLQIS